MDPVPSKDMQTPPPLSFALIFMKDAQCAESNEKSIIERTRVRGNRHYNNGSAHTYMCPLIL